MTDIPISKIPEYVETYLSVRDHIIAGEADRPDAFKLFASARAEAGLETNESEFTSLCAADLRTLADDFSKFQAPAKEVFTVGAFDSKTQTWG